MCIHQMIDKAEVKILRVCTRGKECVGSIDGKTFLYEDKSQDNGQDLKIFKFKDGLKTFIWSEEELPLTIKKRSLV